MKRVTLKNPVSSGLQKEDPEQNDKRDAKVPPPPRGAPPVIPRGDPPRRKGGKPSITRNTSPNYETQLKYGKEYARLEKGEKRK